MKKIKKSGKEKQKRGERAERINAMAQTNTKSIKESAKKNVSAESERKRKKLEQAGKRKQCKIRKSGGKGKHGEKFNENN